MILNWLIVSFALVAAEPLQLPHDFNFEGDVSIRRAAELAEQFLANGTPEDIETAQKLLQIVMSAQEKRTGAAHRGNFLWNSNSATVQDLNAVEFTLSYLIPMMVRNGDRLPEDIRKQVLDCIRLGLEEIKQLDVAVTYTNIASMDCLNSCLGGELLSDEVIASRGYAKFERFAEITASNGTIFEYHSPGYMLVTMRALKRLAENVRHEDTRIRARAMAARLALGTALRIHPKTNRMAGPFSRAYSWQLLFESDTEADIVRQWIADKTAPAWIEHALQSQKLPMQIDETAVADWNIGTTAYLSPSFSFGVASREVSRQSSVLVIHGHRLEKDHPDLVYSRYKVEESDKREENSNAGQRHPAYERYFEQGKFYGVQSKSRAIVVYAPLIPEYFSTYAPFHVDAFSSAKTALIWNERDSVDSIWIDDRLVNDLPAQVKPGGIVTFSMGSVLIAVRPLTITEMGHQSPIQIVEADGRLVFEMYNYLGPRKSFWELDRFSRFYQGQPICAFYVEVDEHSKYPDGKSFCRTIAKGKFRENIDPPGTSYIDSAERLWSAEYERDGETLGMEVDILQWKLKRRWNHEGDLGWPMLECPNARQNDTGQVAVGDAELTCGKHPAWLFADPEAKVWAAGYYGPPAPFKLIVPGGSVEIESMGTGTLVWKAGVVTIEAIGLQGTPKVMNGFLKEQG